MIHVGDITKLNGAELPVVDVVTGGSPCQDLSVAGKRAGLAGERSGLFMEQVRIVKEMREHDRSTGRTGYLTRPRYMLWENVPGAFSSNKGEDFRAVLEEIAKVEQEDAHIPRPEGSWPYAGCVMGDGWSIAWRLHDAQFWGVPQRRKRIALVADFGGQSAPEILFERKGMRRDTEESGEEREGTSSDVKGGVATVGALCARDHKGVGSQYVEEGKVVTKGSIVRRLTPLECERLQGFPSEKRWDVSKMTKDEYIAWNLAEGNIVADPDTGKVFGTRGPGGVLYEKPRELKGSELNGYRVVSIRNGATKLQCRVHRIIWISQNGVIPEGYVIDHINNNKSDNRLSNLQLLTPKQNSSKARKDGLYLTGLDNKATKLDPQLKDDIAFLYQHTTATQRQLAEMYGVSKSRINQIIKEVGWTDIGEWTDSKGKTRKCSDSARYKALGNSIAIPFWFYILRRMAAQYERPATLGSLFDGIGGFPLCWERCNGKGTAIWASEVEEFAIAVTKRRFPNGELETSSDIGI